MQTYARQTLLFGEDELTSLQAVSPASRSRSQASAKARRTSVTCGRKCCGLFGLFDLDGSWARTFSELLIGRKEWSSTRCALTWRRQDMRFNRTLYRLAVSVLPTEGTDAGLLPTVQTHGLKQCEKGKTVFMPLKLLPTPTAIDAGSGRINRSLPPGGGGRTADIGSGRDNGIIADSYGKRRTEQLAAGVASETEKRACQRDRKTFARTTFESFPSQSPLCCRDDVFPDGLDGITFPRWVRESIKAYGNAIVPQVALQIFKTINEYENHAKKY